VKIFAALAGAAVAAGLMLGCGGPPPVTAGGRESPVPYLPPPTRLDSVFVLEWGGVPPEDTVVRVAKGRRRVILIRRGPPDNSLFARVEVPVSAFAAAGADSVPIAVRPLPGRYGVDLEFPADSSTRVELAFSYALTFVAPAGARAAYGSDLEFEKALLIARLETDGRITFLPTTSPGADIVTATVSLPGRYVVAAPRR
jgi:hypothetical protein